MRHTVLWTLVLICLIISLILLAIYDVSLAKQGLDKYERLTKIFPIIFFTGLPLAICSNIYFKQKYNKK